MADYFAANDIAAFSLVSGTPTEVTTAGRFDSNYAGRAIQFGGTTGAILLSSPQIIDPVAGTTTSLTTAWLHFDFYTSNNAGTWSCLELANSAGTSVVRVSQATNAGTMRVDYWNGSAWVSGGFTFVGSASAIITIDVQVVCGVSGSIALYCNNTLIGTTSGLNAAVTNIAYVKLTGNSGQCWSQILISDTSTVGAKVATLKPTALGTDTAWSPNTVGNLEKVSWNDTTLISDSTLNDKVSYAAADITLPSGMFVSSAWFAIRARLNASSPANIKPLLRIGSTDYAGAYNFGGLNSSSFAPAIAAFVNDPSTGTAWSGVTNLNAAEVGLQTAA